MKKQLFRALLACLVSLSLVGAVGAATIAPSGLYAAQDGTLIFTDLLQRAVWKQTADGTLTRLAGRESVRDINGLPQGGYNDAVAAQAAFQTPWAVAPYQDGWAVTDTHNHAVRLLQGGSVRTLAGTGRPGRIDGVGKNASFDGPTGLTAGPDGNLLVADTGNHAIRQIDAAGKVTTLVSSTAGLLEPTGLFYAEGALYVADSGNHRICKIENGAITVLAGISGEAGDGYRDGPAAQALFSSPQGVAVQDGIVYVADTGNGAIRAIDNGIVSTLMQSGAGGDGLYPISPRGLALRGDTLLVADNFAQTVFSVSAKLPQADFLDVPKNAWYADAVNTINATGWMGGTAKQQFSPALPLTRAMCATALYRVAGGFSTTPAAFSDVPADAYYVKPAAWAAEQGLLRVQDGVFGPRSAVSRAEFLVALRQCASIAGLDVTPPQSIDLSAFSDGGAVPAWASDALRWALGANILSGRSGTLAPSAPVTRAEAATLLVRYTQWLTPN